MTTNSRRRSASRKSKLVRRGTRTRRVPVHRHRMAAHTRKGHTRKGRTRKGRTRGSKIRVKPAHVSSKVIEVRGVGHPTIILPKPLKHTLGRFGYHTNDKPSVRHSAAIKAAKSKGYSDIIKHMNEIAILNMNSNPDVSKILRDDMEYLKRHRIEYDKSEQAVKMIKRLTRKKRTRSTRKKRT